MSEQTKQDWKEQRIAEYAHLENEIALEMHEMGTDPDLIRLMKEQAKLNDMIALAKGIYAKNIEAAQQQQAGIKLELAEKWDIDEKTFKSDIGEIVLRTTRSLVIQDKDKLIGFLQTIKKLNECIRNFDISKIRKFKEVGLIENEIATWSEKYNISIRLIGGRNK